MHFPAALTAQRQYDTHMQLNGSNFDSTRPSDFVVVVYRKIKIIIMVPATKAVLLFKHCNIAHNLKDPWEHFKKFNEKNIIFYQNNE